jgi:hypothetical protein
MYLGNQPALSYTSFAKQDFTTSATTSYTLDHPVTNENELALFINFVRQEPTTAYTASGTTLTLTSATSSSDDMYCVFLGKAVQTVNPPNSSVGNSQLDVSAINLQTAETSIAGGDEVLIYDTSASALRKMTRTNFVSGIGGTNTPAFHAQSTAGTNVSSSDTKIEFNVELFDTAGAYDHSTNYRFTVPSGQAGKYFFYANVRVNSATDFDNVQLMFKKNGNVFNKVNIYNSDYNTVQNSTIADLSVGDYMEVYCYFGTTNTIRSTQNENNFFGYKLVE